MNTRSYSSQVSRRTTRTTSVCLHARELELNASLASYLGNSGAEGAVAADVTVPPDVYDRLYKQLRVCDLDEELANVSGLIVSYIFHSMTVICMCSSLFDPYYEELQSPKPRDTIAVKAADNRRSVKFLLKFDTVFPAGKVWVISYSEFRL